MRMSGAIVLLVLAQGLAGCGPTAPSRVPAPDSNTGPTGPSQPVPQPGGGYPGFVQDTAGRPLAGVRIEVVDGPPAARSMISDADGRFSVPTTLDETVRFRATKEGYVGATGMLQSEGPSTLKWLGFHLEVLAPPVNIAGDYTLTFTADNACTNLPDQVRTRRYAAAIAVKSGPDIPANTRFTLSVSGATFSGSNSFSIGVAGDYLSSWTDDDHGTPFLVEQLAADTYLAFGGTVAAHVGTPVSAISASLDGYIAYCETKLDAASLYTCVQGKTSCTSRSHAVTLTRR